MSRLAFLRLVAGVGVATGLVVTGGLPAFAELETQSAQEWVRKHHNALPDSYREVVKYPLAYRKAIFQALPPEKQSRLWIDHVRQYRAAHPDLTAAQVDVLDNAETLFADAAIFDPANHTPQLERDLAVLTTTARRALGDHEAYQALATLGPSTRSANPEIVPPRPECPCSQSHDWCDDDTTCGKPAYDCNPTKSGCGAGWFFACDGTCNN